MDTNIYHDLFRRSIEIGRKLRNIARSNLEKIDYTWAEFDILRRLKIDEKINVSDLAQRSCRQKSNLVPVINKFEEKGYVKKERNLEDRRNVWISLSPAGEIEKNRILDFQKHYIIEFLSGLSEDTVLDMLKNNETISQYLDTILTENKC